MGLGCCDSTPLRVYVKTGSPIVPLLVVMIKTPFAAREPHIAVAAASFKTEISLISDGDIFKREAYPWSSAVPKLKSEGICVSKGIPSTTIKGFVPAFIEEVPLILMDMPAPGSPEDAVCLLYTSPSPRDGL